jgi:hypothetical protein
MPKLGLGRRQKSLHRAQQNRAARQRISLRLKTRKGVVLNDDGTLWTGSWVVGTNQVERSELINAYVALHEKQSEQSYVQGTIKGWRIAPGEQVYADLERRTEEGIEFLISRISISVPWRGKGTIEKSYWYGDDEAALSFHRIQLLGRAEMAAKSVR